MEAVTSARPAVPPPDRSTTHFRRRLMVGGAGVVAGLFWLFFPVSLLSSLSASSRWFVFTPTLLPRLALRPGSVVAFYLWTAPVLLGGTLAGYALLVSPQAWLLPAGAVGV